MTFYLSRQQLVLELIQANIIPSCKGNYPQLLLEFCGKNQWYSVFVDITVGFPSIHGTSITVKQLGATLLSIPILYFYWVPHIDLHCFWFTSKRVLTVCSLLRVRTARIILPLFPSCCRICSRAENIFCTSLDLMQAQKAVLPYARCLNVPHKNIETLTTSSQHFGLLRCCYLLLPTILQKYAKTSQISDQWLITTTGKWFCNLATITRFFQLLLTNISTMYLASFLITSSQSRQGWCRNVLLDWQPKPQESEIMHVPNNPQKKSFWQD